jgi:hypothetical protein
MKAYYREFRTFSSSAKGMIVTRWGACQAQCDLFFPQTKTATLKQMAVASSRNLHPLARLHAT